MHSIITVRQTLDPYVNDVQYFGSRETTLESNGDLRMSKLGLGKPGDQFLITWYEHSPPVVVTSWPYSSTLPASEVRRMACYESDSYPILTVIELGDYKSASQCHYQRVLAKQREDQVAYLKGLAAHAWNWVASAFYSTPPDPTSSESITSQRSKQL
ncbi:hypothetical protein PILCRDRAFT_829686 [Piloderma croceum F 1598]|uniref:Uncharacterized protein n=1 Tax=Piloderma croceum (strain F 1598) TaxID=765440 RepID=A0A0C3AFG7_PILCF|nr:hypothetical protein PILCRDRAFT_829686 [Piloderma croceum F 1598]